MWNELKALCTKDTNFILNRWDNPLHNDTVTELQGRLWPSSEEFYHPLNPLFSFFISMHAHVDLFKVFLLRDGAEGILEFFVRFPAPKDFKVQILVPADLAFLVPDGWRPRVLCYRLATDRKMTYTNDYLFYGLVSEISLSWPRFRHHLDSWISQFDPNANVKAFFATRNEIYDKAWIDRKISFQIAGTFQSYFKNKIEFLNWKDVVGLSARSNLTYVPLDQWRNGIGLCSVDSMMMAKAPQVWPRGEYEGFRGKKIGSWPVSFQHNIDVFTCECDHSDFANFFFIKKTAPLVPYAPLPHPIIPELMELLAERLTVKGLERAAAKRV